MGRGVEDATGTATPRAPERPDVLVPLWPEGTGLLSERAYHRIRDRIVSLQLAPGTRIDEGQLTADLEIGRTPVREALRRLADERLVQIRPRRGIYVTDVEVEDLGAISEIRVRLETLAAQLAADRATDAQRRRADELAAEIETADPPPERGCLLVLGQQVHHHVYRCAHNPFLAETLERHLAHSLRMWFVALDRGDRLPESIDEHLDLLAAIRDGRGARAAATMRRHVTGFVRETRRVLAGSEHRPVTRG